MTPVMLLTDGYIANGAEPWRIPDVDSLPQIPGQASAGRRTTATRSMPYARDERLARPWALPGTPGLMHRIGGLEKQDVTGNVNYDPANHQHMINLRARKVAGVADDHSAAGGRRPGERRAAGGQLGRHLRRLRHRGAPGCASRRRAWRTAHLRYLNPFPSNLGEIISRFEKVLVPELNCGQLRMLLRAEFLVDAVGLNKVQGKPFAVREVVDKIKSC